MIQLNWWLFFVTALIPLAVGFVWYSPQVFGNAWMKINGFTPEDLKGQNMLKVFLITYFLGLLFSSCAMVMTIHQMGYTSIFQGDESPETAAMISDFLGKYGTRFRTFGHGAFHATIFTLFLILPVIAINAMFERRGWKYIAIHTGYWLVTFILIGGIICQFL
jgi:Protein of unknown function (DUF1761)